MSSGIANSPGRSFALVFLLSVAVRGYLLTLTPAELIREPGSEMGNIARSLAATGEFANPYAIPTGPTAHLPPVYTGLVGLIYALFGVTATADYVRCGLVIAGFSAMYALLPWLAGRLGAEPAAGRLGGLAGAVTPRWPMEVSGGWEEPWVAIAMGFLLVAFLRRWNTPRVSTGGSFWLGVAIGAAFHLAPTLLPVVMGCLAFEIWYRRGGRTWLFSAAMILGMALACVPWAWRNYRAFHELFFIRSNFGLEMRVANQEGAAPSLEETWQRGVLRHPYENLSEATKVRDLGEMKYMRRARREALGWIRTHPGAFLRLTAWRFVHFWFGSPHHPLAALWTSAITVLAFLGAWRLLPVLTVPQRAALLIPLAAYPLVYYVVGSAYRYRVPVYGILLLLAGSAFFRRPAILGGQ
jgi:hypothetical protein